jgi:hypothetical protein
MWPACALRVTAIAHTSGTFCAQGGSPPQQCAIKAPERPGGGGDFSKHLEQANWSNDMTAALSREVQITKDEVLRQLPDAIEGRPFTVENGEIIVDGTDNGRVRIVLTDKGDLEMGAT